MPPTADIPALQEAAFMPPAAGWMRDQGRDTLLRYAAFASSTDPP